MRVIRECDCVKVLVADYNEFNLYAFDKLLNKLE